MPLLTVPEVAEKYRRCPGTVRRQMWTWPEGTVIRMGHSYLIDEEKMLASIMAKREDRPSMPRFTRQDLKRIHARLLRNG